MEYMTREIIFLAGFKPNIKTTTALYLIIYNIQMHTDVELEDLLKIVTIAQRSMVPPILIWPEFPFYIQINNKMQTSKCLFLRNALFHYIQNIYYSFIYTVQSN